MKTWENFKIGGLAVAIVLGAALSLEANERPPLRPHTATERQPLVVQKAEQRAGRSRVSISEEGAQRVITANGVPNHSVGRFPNNGNPNRITRQSYRFVTPLVPQLSNTASHTPRGGIFGVAVNGVPFDPGAAEFWRGNPHSGWQYEALGGAVPLGLDSNFGHVQPSGAYHYHGLPIGLMQALGWSNAQPSPLIGYAADGFPIYAINAQLEGKLVEMTSSYRLRSGTRSTADNGPGGRYDGTFVQDYIYLEGAGTLDACNGAFVTTDEYPAGTYAYFLTNSFPVIPRCHMGTADPSFSKRHR